MSASFAAAQGASAAFAGGRFKGVRDSKPAVQARHLHAQNLPKEGGDLPKICQKSRSRGATCDLRQANKNPANPLD